MPGFAWTRATGTSRAVCYAGCAADAAPLGTRTAGRGGKRMVRDARR